MGQRQLSAFESLSPRWREFVVEYLHDFNASAAYARCGWTKIKCKDGNHRAGPRLLHKPKVLAAIGEELDKRGLTPEAIKIGLAEIAFGADLADFEGFLEGKKLSDLRELGANTRLLSSISKSQTKDGANYRIEIESPLSALKELARIQGLIISHSETMHGGHVDLRLRDLSDEELEREAHAVADEHEANGPGDGNPSQKSS